MKKLKWYIHGTEYVGETNQMLREAGYGIVHKLAEADAVMWTGGTDIHPRMYGEALLAGTYCDSQRDESDLRIVDASDGMLRVGVCRGGQLLNVVPNGGSLWQDVDKHQHGFHNVWDNILNTNKIVNTSHHQVMIPGPRGEIVAFARCSSVKKSPKGVWYSREDEPSASFLEMDIESEVIWYPDTKCLCFQPHPEWNHKPTTDYFFELVERYLEAA